MRTALLLVWGALACSLPAFAQEQERPKVIDDKPKPSSEVPP